LKNRPTTLLPGTEGRNCDFWRSLLTSGGELAVSPASQPHRSSQARSQQLNQLKNNNNSGWRRRRRRQWRLATSLEAWPGFAIFFFLIRLRQAPP